MGRLILVLALVSGVWSSNLQNTDPESLIKEADRLAWLKAWSRAAPLYNQAAAIFRERGDRRNELYAEISALRGQLQRLSVPEVSQRLAEYLDDPIVQRDERLLLRCRVIKGETDEDLDPVLAEQSWREALELAKGLGEDAWANRALGELGIVAYLRGDISASIIQLGQALKTAETNGDVPSQVRWLTLFGHGYVQLGRPEQALTFYDRALKAGSEVEELNLPVMTYLGKGDALAKLGRLDEAEGVINQALAVANNQGAFGYQAELTSKLGMIANERKQTERALRLLNRARQLALQAGGNRILAELALDLAKVQRARHDIAAAESTLQEGISVARNMRERMLLPRLLGQLADLKLARQRYADARALLDEANDLLEGLMAHVSSPWVRSQLVGVMTDVYVARIRLEASRRGDPARVFLVAEQARARSLLELLLSRPVSDLKKPAELRAGERAIAALQVQLYQAQSKARRQQLLDEIFLAEDRLGPVSTELYNRTRHGVRKPVALADVQRALRGDELLLEFTLAEPDSYCIVVARTAARVQRLPGRIALATHIRSLAEKIRSGGESGAEGRTVGAALLDPIREVEHSKRLIVSPDGDLHQLPMELLVGASGRPLLETHVISYVPSGSILSVLRNRRSQPTEAGAILAVGTSPADGPSSNTAALSSVTRGIYDLDLSKLPPLPAAIDEARSVSEILDAHGATALLGQEATELEVKRQRLSDYRVLHFAAHAVVSTQFPDRSALILRPAGDEDGLFQAREILTQRLKADLVTLSACHTGTGRENGQDGVESLVRPFLAAGARSVVASLWAADDRFSLALMKEFYRQLAAGADSGSALRQAKLRMLQQFGPQATPNLWSGILVYGDATSTVSAQRSSRH